MKGHTNNNNNNTHGESTTLEKYKSIFFTFKEDIGFMVVDGLSGWENTIKKSP